MNFKNPFPDTSKTSSSSSSHSSRPQSPLAQEIDYQNSTSRTTNDQTISFSSKNPRSNLAYYTSTYSEAASTRSNSSSSSSASSSANLNQNSNSSSTTRMPSLDIPRRGPSVEVMRCSRCAKTVETVTRSGAGITPADAIANGMIRFGHNLYYCDRCARMVGYK